MVFDPDRFKSFFAFVDLIFVVVVTIGVEQTADIFQLLPNAKAAMLAVAILFIALSFVYYHLSVQDDPYDGSSASWLRFALDVAIAFLYIGLFLTISNPLGFGRVLAVIYTLYGLHGFTVVLQVHWYRPSSSGGRPSSLPAYWFFFVPIFLVAGFLLAPLSSGPIWQQYIPPLTFGILIGASRLLRHRPTDWAYRAMVRMRLEPLP